MAEKRDIESTESVPNSKRIKVGQLSESGPLTFRDVVYFQKEAIFRELNLARAKCTTLVIALKNSTAESQQMESKFLSMKSLVESFVENLKPFDKDNYLQNIKISAQENTNERISMILDALTKFISVLAKGNIPSNFEDLSLKLYQLQTQYDSLSLENNRIIKNYTQLNDIYLKLVKENDRSHSRTLQRIRPKSDELLHSDHAEELTKPVSTISTPNVDKGDASEVSEKLNEYIKTIETQKRLLDEQVNSNQKLNEQINLLNQSKREEIEVKNSDVYLNLVKDYDTLNSEYIEINKKFESLIEKFHKNELSVNEHHDSIVSKFQDEKEKVFSQFEKLEMDLARIRTTRDDLLAKVNILEHSKDSQEIIKELNKTLEIQKSAIELLNFEEKLNTLMTNAEGEEDVDKLKRNNLVLVNELKEFEKLFKNLQATNFKKFQHIIENESILNKYRVEKKKADEKYFAVMRTKDSTTTEIKTLKDLNKKYELKINSIEELRKSQDLELANQIKKNSHMAKLIQAQKAAIVKNDLTVTKLTSSLSLEIKKNLDSTNQLNELTSMRTEQLNKITDLELKLSKADSKNKLQSQQLSNRNSQSSGSVELDSYRSLIYCSLCSKNWKNTAIKTCGHVFCNDCTQERINARMRKCPTCNKPFSNNDVLSIHL